MRGSSIEGEHTPSIPCDQLNPATHCSSTNISQIYHKYITNISQIYYKYITNMSQIYYKCIKNISFLQPVDSLTWLLYFSRTIFALFVTDLRFVTAFVRTNQTVLFIFCLHTLYDIFHCMYSVQCHHRLCDPPSQLESVARCTLLRITKI